MTAHPLLTETGLAGHLLLRGVIAAAHDDCHFDVAVRQGNADWLVRAELVVGTERPIRLVPGDSVLCAIEDEDRGRGMILGRVGPSSALPSVDRTLVAAPDELPTTLVLEARESLTLRVGDGSITIRGDGKVLIKGKDLVSHAQRMNRIKGGSVAIN
jgi:hypothetical protein